jgi:hypothetical protein
MQVTGIYKITKQYFHDATTIRKWAFIYILTELHLTEFHIPLWPSGNYVISMRSRRRALKETTLEWE